MGFKFIKSSFQLCWEILKSSISVLKSTEVFETFEDLYYKMGNKWMYSLLTIQFNNDLPYKVSYIYQNWCSWSCSTNITPDFLKNLQNAPIPKLDSQFLPISKSQFVKVHGWFRCNVIFNRENGKGVMGIEFAPATIEITPSSFISLIN